MARLARWALFFGILMAAHALTLGAWTSSALERAERELEENRGQIRKLERAAERLPQFHEELQRLETRLEQTAFALPEARSAWLAVEASYLAEQSGVELLATSAGALESREFYAATPLRIEAQGELTSLGDFSDGLMYLQALELQAIEIAQLEAGGYSARIDLEAYEWIPGAASGPPSCERGEADLYAAAELVASAIPVESRLERGEGWRRRRAGYRLTRIFARGVIRGVPRQWWPREGETIPVVRSCLTSPAPPERGQWPARVEYCPESDPTLPAFGSSDPEGAAPPEELLLMLRSPFRDAGWELMDTRGLEGVCGAPLRPESEAGLEAVRAWKRARGAGPP